MLAALVAGGWVMVTLTYLSGWAAIVPPVLLVGTASLLRGGRSLLDRMMLATGLLLGLTCLGGLVFAVWPWGLHPVAVGGTATTALIAVAARTGRRPQLPRPRGVDAVVAVAVTAVGVFVAWPLLRDGRTGRLAVMLDGEDLSRHAALFDAIRRTGGYLFQHPAQGRTLVYDGMVSYPQGEHLIAALLDGYARSSGSTYGSGPGMFDHYVAAVVGGYLLLTASLIWAAQWIGAGGLSTGRLVPLAGGIAVLCGGSELLELLRLGYPSQVLGLAEAVLLLALLVRPVPRRRQQLLLVAALLVAVGFTYYLYLPPVGLAAVLWVFHSGHHRSAKIMTSVLVASIVSAVPLAIGILVAGQAQALLSVGTLRVGREGLVALGILIASGIVTRRGRRSRIWRAYVLAFVPVAGFAVGMLTVQRLFGNGSGYYANKALFLVLAMLLAGTGALALHLPRPDGVPVRVAVPAASVLIAVVALTGGAPPAPPYTSAQHRWLTGPDAEQLGYARSLLAAGTTGPTVVIGDDPGYDSYKLTLYLQTLQRTSGPAAPATYRLSPVNTPQRLDAVVTRMPRTAQPMRLLALSDDAYGKALALRGRHPDIPIEVVRG